MVFLWRGHGRSKDESSACLTTRHSQDGGALLPPPFLGVQPLALERLPPPAEQPRWWPPAPRHPPVSNRGSWQNWIDRRCGADRTSTQSPPIAQLPAQARHRDRKSTRLNSS